MSGRPPELDLIDAIRAAQQHAQALVGVLSGGAEHLRPRAHVSADVLAQIEHVAAVQRAPDDRVVRHTRDLLRDLAYARDVAAALDTGPRSVAGALTATLTGDLRFAADMGGDPAQVRELLRSLNAELHHARMLVPRRLEFHGRPKRAAGSADRHREPGVLCRHVVAGAVRVLPAAHQERYAREYAAELWELGAQPGTRRRRFAYALRLGASCWTLRRVLTGQRQEV